MTKKSLGQAEAFVYTIALGEFEWID